MLQCQFSTRGITCIRSRDAQSIKWGSTKTSLTRPATNGPRSDAFFPRLLHRQIYAISSTRLRALKTETEVNPASSVPETALEGPSSSQSFGITSQELSKIVQDAFEERGVIKNHDGSSLSALVRSSTQKGISAVDVAARQATFGCNKLPPPGKVTFWQLVWDALQDSTVVLLICAGAASLLLSSPLVQPDGTGEATDWIEGCAILASVLIVVAVSATTNYQKESKFRQLNTIKDDIPVRAIRDGSEVSVSTYDLVVGDVLLVETGDIIPADGIIFQGADLKVDESHMTGESDDVNRSADEASLMLAGSKVREGYGRMLVLAVGTSSQQGLLNSLVMGSASSTEVFDSDSNDESLRGESTFLMKKLEVLATQIGNFGLAAAVAVLVVNVAGYTMEKLQEAGEGGLGAVFANVDHLQHYLDLFITSITIVVVAVPEGLPLAVTIALAFSVQRMLSDNNLVRHLDACETMACVTTVCSDKTGTLTENNMTVVKLWAGGQLVSVKSSKANHAISEGKVKPVELEARSGSGATATSEVVMLQPALQDLLVDSLVLNSTACIRVKTRAELDEGGPGAATLEKSGNRTECALLEFALRLSERGMNQEGLKAGKRVLQVIPFSSQRKRMSVLMTMDSDDAGSNARLLTKGAAELVLEECSKQVLADGSVAPLGEEDKARLVTAFGSHGLRLLALAYRDVQVPASEGPATTLRLPADELEQELVLVGIMGLQDPLREDVPGAIAQCQRAGINVRMLTGDNAWTAANIARSCGILPASSNTDLLLKKGALLTRDSMSSLSCSSLASTSGLSSLSSGEEGGLGELPEYLVLEGPQFRKLVQTPEGALDAAAFRTIWPRLKVIARCSPTDKYLLVNGIKTLRNEGGFSEVVAVTGDGTNDAPALTAADVGFAMNSGTSIAKDAADILLMDDSFSSIVSAVEWGRNVYSSITKFLQFQLTANVVAVATACVGAIALHESPLSAVQMLWVNLIMDSLASLALATEAPTDKMLDLPPCSTEQRLINNTVFKHIAGQSVFQLSVLYVLVFHGGELFGVDDLTKNTIVFNTFVCMQLFNQVNCRKVRDEPDILDGLTTHPLFSFVVASEAILQVVIVQYGGAAFQTTPLDLPQWGACVGTGALTLFVRSLLIKVKWGEEGADQKLLASKP